MVVVIVIVVLIVIVIVVIIVIVLVLVTTLPSIRVSGDRIDDVRRSSPRRREKI